MRALWIMVTVVLLGPLAHADSAAQLQAQGEKLAKEGNYADAIDAFKAADQLKPRASNACYIALAYTRRQLWPQAEVFLARCHERASAGDPLPTWVPKLDETITKHIADADVAAIELVVTPKVEGVTVTLSSFAPGETFSPRTLHLSFGQHVVFVNAPGFETAQAIVNVKSRDDQRVTIELRPQGTAATAVVQGAPPPGPTAGPVAKFVSANETTWEVLVDQRVVCRTPCERAVSPLQTFSLRNGDLLFNKVTVGHLRSDTNVVVTAKPYGFFTMAGGAMLAGTGGTLLLAGGIVTAVNCCKTGLVLGAFGAVTLVGGVALIRRAKPRSYVRTMPYVAGNVVGVVRSY